MTFAYRWITILGLELFSDNTLLAWNTLLTHIEKVGAFEFGKEIFAIIGVAWFMYSIMKLFFSLLIWSEPKHPHQIQGRL